MLDFQEKKKVKSIIYSKISIVVIAILLILVIKNVWIAYGDARVTKSNRDIAEQELLGLQEREVEIKFDIENLSTQQGVEKEIRNKFRVAKEGEEMVMIVDPEEDKKNKSNNNISLWSKFMNFLGF